MPEGHARHHHHHLHHRHSHPASQISAPPEASPPAAPPLSGDDWRVYDVRMFGAIGDGATDDTGAFKSAWENACQIDSGVLLVPYGYTFIIQSTIFTGPCQNGLIFQVPPLFLSGNNFVSPKVDGTIMPPEGPDA
ncbi:hypothetical protein SASPL_105004 [Salvia splendens]|uniref:Pectate lyase superfamily protein domain-containing protein n=1 Tax=Salvia splendens TaxID=180675 RepID=A0A8X9AAC0_SALSN|nr:hypothetical protein SASPL_105004 [Salvia splendens]